MLKIRNFSILLLTFLLAGCGNNPISTSGTPSSASSYTTTSQESSSTTSSSSSITSVRPTLTEKNIFNPDVGKSGYFNNSGSRVFDTDYWTTNNLDVKPNDSLLVGPLSTSQPANIMFYQKGTIIKDKLDLSLIEPQFYVSDYGFYEISIADDVDQIAITSYSNIRYQVTATINFSYDISDYYEFLEANNQPDIINHFVTNEKRSGYLSGSLPAVMKDSSTSYVSGFIKVKEGQEIYLAPVNPNNTASIYCFSDKSLDTGYPANSKDIVTYEVGRKLYFELNNKPYTIQKYIVPEGVNFIKVILNSVNSQIFYITINQEMSFQILSDIIPERLRGTYGRYYPSKTTSVLHEKKAVFIGDSISAGVGDYARDSVFQNRAWAGRIGDINEMTYSNKSVSGSSISTSRAASFGRIINQIKSSPISDPDYIVMHGGVNDAWDSAPIGEISPYTTKDAPYKTNTYAGGLEELFAYVTETYPNAKLMYIINFKLPLAAGGRIREVDQYFEVARDICDKWYIPYLDLYNENQLNKDLKGTTNEFIPDRVHPNNAGYDIIYPYVEEFMETL